VGARSTWIAVAVAVIVVGGVLALVASMWTAIGDAEISTGGWIALVLGVLFALALGFGLMALVFISSRGGYDDPDDRR
jgi:cation transporter-like permease